MLMLMLMPMLMMLLLDVGFVDCLGHDFVNTKKVLEKHLISENSSKFTAKVLFGHGVLLFVRKSTLRKILARALSFFNFILFIY